MYRNCVEFLDESSAKFPQKVAFIDAKASITFQELRNHSLILSQRIPKNLSNKPILIFLPKDIKAIIAIFGTLYSENFYVPIDIKSPSVKINLIIQDLKPSYIITNSELHDKLSKTIEFPQKKFIIIENFSKLKSVTNSVSSKDTKFDQDSPAYCIYTSGSTGNPKGVLISHRSLENFIKWSTDCFKVDDKTILGNQSPLFFDVSVMDLFLTIKNGATTYLIPEIIFAFPTKLIDFISFNKIDHIIWVPSVLSSVAKNKALLNKTTSLKNVLFAGEELNFSDLNYWKQNLAYTNFHNLYGPTEATVISTYHKIKRDYKYDRIPIGKPIDNVSCVVLDENEQEIEVGEIGELYVSGISLALCYWNNPIKTSKEFRYINNLKKGNKRWYRTGDLVIEDKNGNFTFVGRKDTQIKFMGYRIELGEIENAVSKLDFVDKSCVIFDKKRNEIVLIFESDNSSVDEDMIKVNLMKIIQKYMVPKKIIRTKQMPLNSNGKIDRKLLINKYTSK